MIPKYYLPAVVQVSGGSGALFLASSPYSTQSNPDSMYLTSEPHITQGLPDVKYLNGRLPVGSVPDVLYESSGSIELYNPPLYIKDINLSTFYLLESIIEFNFEVGGNDGDVTFTLNNPVGKEVMSETSSTGSVQVLKEAAMEDSGMWTLKVESVDEIINMEFVIIVVEDPSDSKKAETLAFSTYSVVVSRKSKYQGPHVKVLI